MQTFDVKKNNITQDVTDAKLMGLSYGKYKAGEKSDNGPSEYSQHPSEFINKRDLSKVKNKKYVAYIK